MVLKLFKLKKKICYYTNDKLIIINIWPYICERIMV